VTRPPDDSARGSRTPSAGRDPGAVFLAELAKAPSLDAALACGVRALAALSGARAAAILPLEGGEASLETWHPNDPAVRESLRAAFGRAATAARTGDPDPGGPRESGAIQVLPLVSAGVVTGTLCLAAPPGAGSAGSPTPALVRVAAVVASLAATHQEQARGAAARREYERWFKTLDEQIRVLERERQKFAALVHRSDAEVFVTDRAGLIRWTNAVLASHPAPGPAGASWIGQGCAAVCSRGSEPGPHPECGTCPVTRALAGSEAVHHEFRRGNPSSPRMLYLSALPIKGPDGRPHEVLVMVQDLSDLEVLRRSESRYRLLFERSAKAIVMVDPATGRIMMANPMASRMTGLAAEELCARTLEDLHPAAEWPQVAERYRAGFSAGNLAPFECHIRTLDGGELLASVTGTRYDLDGQEVEMLEYQDVTESRRVEEALRNAEERLRSVVANAPVVLFAIDEHGTFTLSEGQGLAGLGLRPGQVVGCSAFELYAQHPQILANFRRAMAGESFMDRVDVGDLSFETWYAPTRGPDGRPQGLIGVSNDVSRRRHLEDQLRQAQKMEAIGRLAGGVAHDFNNLLAAIMGHGELLLRRLEPNQPQHRHAEAIQKAATRGALLTRQLLAFSRKEVLAPSVLDIHLVVAEMEEMLRRLIGEHIELVIVLGERPVHVRADRGQLEQVIMNLAVNARDAMADGGVLTVEVATVARMPEGEGVPAEAGRPADRYVTIAVRDTGCGMDAATAARIFEPFFTTKEQGKGTGLGLSTVYGIVEQSGGSITVDSALGGGTTFTVTLPRLEERILPDGAEASSPAGTRGSETVLLVEDEPSVRAVACEALETHGYRVVEAQHGAEALAVACAHPGVIDLLITDMVMPQMGGRELAEQLRRLRPGIRVLFMSGYTDDVVVRRGISRATSAFLQKPFAMSAFTRKVRETLDAPPADLPGASEDDAGPALRAA
jgi:two-component system cell cycle sensor histidine kinase/response regulator CckA